MSMSNMCRLTLEEPESMTYLSTSFQKQSENECAASNNDTTEEVIEDKEIVYPASNLTERLLNSSSGNTSSSDASINVNYKDKILKEESEGESMNHDIVFKEGEEINPWSMSYIGIPVNYFSVGVIYAGSVSILYPILVIQNGVTSSYYTAATNLVTLFWSYKILFGFLSDCFPIRGYKKKSYILLGWIVCAMTLICLAGFGNDISPTNLVLMLTFANLGYVMADVAADGFMVWIAHREPMERRGKMQTLVYTIRESGRICINVIIIFAFSGPKVSELSSIRLINFHPNLINASGELSRDFYTFSYEPDDSIPCTTDEDVMDRNDLSEDYPDTWCHMKCDDATFDFGLTVPQYVWIIAGINIASLPFYMILKEEKSPKESASIMVSSIWRTLQRSAIWEIMLYSMISNITFNVNNPAKVQANYAWLHLTNAQNQILNIMESVIFFVGLGLIRKYALNYSWRKLMWIGSLIVTVFNLMYLLVVYDIIRNPWFYIFTDVSATFIYTLNFMASTFCIVEVAEPGYEAVTYALITTSSNAVVPLSSVISYQSLALFPKLNTQEDIEEDTPAVRNQFACLLLITILINLSSLLSLPMLPRQKKETRELVAKDESSVFWARFTVISLIIFLLYSTVVTFVTVAAANTYGCYKIFGGAGCSDNESSAPVFILIISIFVYCYGVNFYHTFWPIVNGEKPFHWDMFF